MQKNRHVYNYTIYSSRILPPVSERLGSNRNFSKTSGKTPIFEVMIVIYDKKHV